MLICVQLFVNPWMVAHLVPLSLEFSRQEYWSGLPFPPPGDLSNPGMEPTSFALAGRFFTIKPPGKLQTTITRIIGLLGLLGLATVIGESITTGHMCLTFVLHLSFKLREAFTKDIITAAGLI